MHKSLVQRDRRAIAIARELADHLLEVVKEDCEGSDAPLLKSVSEILMHTHYILRVKADANEARLDHVHLDEDLNLPF